ncbi:hypothetical protein Q1695_001394 [Nippostrongylus brasiliensis]|nr:hypothetical protein Q1695_001394 [Nippostrongylus brasiliensis]
MVMSQEEFHTSYYRKTNLPRNITDANVLQWTPTKTDFVVAVVDGGETLKTPQKIEPIAPVKQEERTPKKVLNGPTVIQGEPLTWTPTAEAYERERRDIKRDPDWKPPGRRRICRATTRRELPKRRRGRPPAAARKPVVVELEEGIEPPKRRGRGRAAARPPVALPARTRKTAVKAVKHVISAERRKEIEIALMCITEPQPSTSDRYLYEMVHYVTLLKQKAAFERKLALAKRRARKRVAPKMDDYLDIPLKAIKGEPEEASESVDKAIADLRILSQMVSKTISQRDVMNRKLSLIRDSRDLFLVEYYSKTYYYSVPTLQEMTRVNFINSAINMILLFAEEATRRNLKYAHSIVTAIPPIPYNEVHNELQAPLFRAASYPCSSSSNIIIKSEDFCSSTAIDGAFASGFETVARRGGRRGRGGKSTRGKRKPVVRFDHTYV